MALRAVVASFAVHAGLAVGIAAGAGGHAPAASAVAAVAPIEAIEIDSAAETVEVPAPIVPVDQPQAKESAAPVHPSDHTHPYPVPADHDARPHDPSQPHDRGGEHDRDHDHDHDHAASAPARAAQAAPVVASDAPRLPVFTMSSGNGTMAAGSTRVAADARGNGAGAGGAAATATYAANAVSAPAKLVAGATAAYPPDARADDVEGDVDLEIVVDAEGRVVDARVVKRAGHGFDEAALAAIRAYRFSPAQRDGQRVRVRMPWTVQFRLR